MKEFASGFRQAQTWGVPKSIPVTLLCVPLAVDGFLADIAAGEGAFPGDGRTGLVRFGLGLGDVFAQGANA